MLIHIFDFLNQNKKGSVKEAEFSSISISHSIDDFSSLSIGFDLNNSPIEVIFSPFDNIYIEDDFGNIIFGGVIANINAKSQAGSLTAYDHRWILTKIILDSPISINQSQNAIDVTEEIIEAVKAKRFVPINFSREGSDVLSIGEDLHFAVGETSASVLQKTIQTLMARWAVRYTRDGNSITGDLIVRSISGVTPEGVGISRSFARSEDGEVITLHYAEGKNVGNLLDFDFTIDVSNYSSRVKVAAKINDQTVFITAPPDGTSSIFEFFFGRAEKFQSDYNADSAITAHAISQINQVYPRQDISLLLSPDFPHNLRCGDRVNILIESPILTGVTNISGRIDSIRYDRKDGFSEIEVFANFMNPQNRTGKTGLIEIIDQMNKKLNDIDKNLIGA